MDCARTVEIRRDPALLDQARDTLDRWMAIQPHNHAEPYLIEWRVTIDQGIDTTIALMTIRENMQRTSGNRRRLPASSRTMNGARFLPAGVPAIPGPDSAFGETTCYA